MHNGKTYCLEDIDNVSRLPPPSSDRRGVWVYIASIIFILSALLLSYSIYPEAAYLGHYVMTTSFLVAYNVIITTYSISVLNLLAVFFCFVSGIVILTNSRRAHTFCGLVLGLMLILMTYEYLNFNAQYLFIIAAATIINMAVIAGGRMSLLGMKRFEESYSQVDWPRPEVF